VTKRTREGITAGTGETSRFGRVKKASRRRDTKEQGRSTWNWKNNSIIDWKIL